MLRQRVHEARVVERPVVGHRRGETRPPRRRRGRRYHCRERLLAVGADERRLTNTRVGVRGRRQTNAVVETWRGIARTTVRRREGNVTVQAAKTDRAKAQDQAGRAHARSAVETRRRGAQVHACVAHAARVARWTRARVATATATAARDASRSVSARRRGALIRCGWLATRRSDELVRRAEDGGERAENAERSRLLATNNTNAKRAGHNTSRAEKQHNECLSFHV